MNNLIKYIIILFRKTKMIYLKKNYLVTLNQYELCAQKQY